MSSYQQIFFEIFREIMKTFVAHQNVLKKTAQNRVRWKTVAKTLFKFLRQGI